MFIDEFKPVGAIWVHRKPDSIAVPSVKYSEKLNKKILLVRRRAKAV